MGYQRSVTDLAPPPPVRLEVVDHQTFHLLTPFAYVTADGEAIPVPEEDTDLATVPSLLWGVLASYGRQTRAALVHDRLCDLVDAMPRATRTQRRAAYAARKRADDVFREALRDSGQGAAARVGWFRAWLFWCGVSFGRYLGFRKVRAVLLAAQALLGAAVLWAALFGPVRLTTYGVLLLLSAGWLRDWRIAFLAVLAAPFVLPALVATVLAQVVFAVPDGAAKLVHWHHEPPPVLRPTLRLPS